MKNFKLLLFLIPVMCFGLMGCQPKGTTLYQNPTPEQYPIKQMMVVIDYLNLRDDVGTYWDFDSYYHQKVLNLLLNDTTSLLQQAGYPKVDAYLLSSGLLIRNEFAVEHYINEELQAELLYPPFILAQQNIPEAHIVQHQEYLTLMVKYVAQRRHHINNEDSYRGMQMAYHFEELDLPADTGILYVHVDLSAPGAIKQLSALLLSGAVASQTDYASVHIDSTYKRHASALLIHKGSGQILWKNHSNSWTPELPISALLSDFPSQQ